MDCSKSFSVTKARSFNPKKFQRDGRVDNVFGLQRCGLLLHQGRQGFLVFRQSATLVIEGVDLTFQFFIRPTSTNGFHFIKGSFYWVVNRGYKHQIRICEPVKEFVSRNHPSFCIIQFGGRHPPNVYRRFGGWQPPNWFYEFGTQRMPNLALRNNVLCDRLFQLWINEVQPPELTKPALVQSFDIQPLFQFLQQLFAVCGTVFTVLLKLHDIAAHEPIAGSQGEVYSVCGLRLQRALYRADMFY